MTNFAQPLWLSACKEFGATLKKHGLLVLAAQAAVAGGQRLAILPASTTSMDE